jgi:hypothetical protein
VLNTTTAVIRGEMVLGTLFTCNIQKVSKAYKVYTASKPCPTSFARSASLAETASLAHCSEKNTFLFFWGVLIYRKLPSPRTATLLIRKTLTGVPLGGEPYVKIPGTWISKCFYCKVWSLFGDNFFL